MAVTKGKILSNISRIRDDGADACARDRRNQASVSIDAVTKSVDVETIKNLLDAGVTDLAENRAKELVDRAEAIAGYVQRRRTPLDGDVRWHMVGTFQRNKVRKLLPVISVIHSIDSLRLAEEVNTRAEAIEKAVPVFLQVNCTGEDQKSGCAVGAAVHLSELICTLRQLRLVGLMTMGPTRGGAEAARPAFVRLREIFEEIRREKIGGDAFKHLSMGMSNDYRIAVEEGATMLRLGRVLFA